MKIKELIQQLQELDENIEIRISLRKGWRPYMTKSISRIDKVIDQDTNRIGFYAIDINTESEYPETKENLIIPEHKSDIEYK